MYRLYSPTKPKHSFLLRVVAVCVFCSLYIVWSATSFAEVVAVSTNSFNLDRNLEFWLALSAAALLLFFGFRIVVGTKRLAQITRDVRKGEASLRTVLNSIGDAVVVVDNKCLLVGFNPMAEKFLGCSPLQSIGLSLDKFFNLIDTRSRDFIECPTRQVISSHEVMTLPDHTTLVALDRREYQIAGSVSPLRDDRGVAIGAVLAFRNVSEDYILRQKLRESQKRFTDVTNSLNDVLILIDPQLRVQLMNKAGMQAYKVDPANYQGQLCYELFWNLSTPCENCPSQQVMKDGKVAKALRVRDNGQVLDRSIYPVYGDADQLIGTAVIASDITDRYHAEQALRRSQEQLSDVASSMPGAIFQFSFAASGQVNVNYIGEGMRTLAGLDESVDIMQPLVLLNAVIAADKRQVLKSTRMAAQRGTVWDDEFRFATPQGEKWVHGRAYPRKEDDGSIIFNGVLTDISSSKAIETELKHRVNHDQLTGLVNATSYRDRLEQALLRARRQGEMLAVVMLDLDHFKEINDSLGHAAGDDLLQQVSRRLQEHLRGDDTVARIGGDEFLVLLKGFQDQVSLVPVLDRMMLTFSQPFCLEGQELRISASVGVTTYPKGGDSVGTLIKNADVAMYKAKKNGKGHYCFYAT